MNRLWSDERRDAEADAYADRKAAFIAQRAAELSANPEEVCAILCDAFLGANRSLDPKRADRALDLTKLFLSGDQHEFCDRLMAHVNARCVDQAATEWDDEECGK